MRLIDDDIPRYKKQAKKVTPKKSNHKHKFVNCVFLMPSKNFDEAHGFVHVPDSEFSIGTYCSICGKIGSTIDRDWLADDCHFWPRTWSDRAKQEFAENTRTLPCFRIEDEWFSKYVGDEIYKHEREDN